MQNHYTGELVRLGGGAVAVATGTDFRGMTVVDAGGPAQPELQPRIDCWEVTTGEARALDEVLSDVGFEEWRSTQDGVVAFQPPADLGHGIDLWFTPVLPHGEFADAMRGPIV